MVGTGTRDHWSRSPVLTMSMTPVSRSTSTILFLAAIPLLGRGRGLVRSICGEEEDDLLS